MLIVSEPQWSFMAQRNKTYQSLHTQTILSGKRGQFIYGFKSVVRFDENMKINYYHLKYYQQNCDSFSRLQF